jgi:hypothetical protein
MGRALILLLGLSLIIERVTDKILYLLPTSNNRIYSWLISTILGLLISFSFRFGFIQELGLSSSLHIAQWVDYTITGLLVASGSEPIHSLIDILALKKKELKSKTKDV